MMTFMTCHLLGMSSTCTNPALYGYLNQNLQMEMSRSVRDFKEWLGWETIKIGGTTVKIQTRGADKVKEFLISPHTLLFCGNTFYPFPLQNVVVAHMLMLSLS